jgi:hypothetical protein
MSVPGPWLTNCGLPLAGEHGRYENGKRARPAGFPMVVIMPFTSPSGEPQECAMDGYELERASWIWGLSLIALTIAIHALGVVTMSLVVVRIRDRLDRWHPRDLILVGVAIVAAAGLLLAVLHGLEATIWAASYLWLGALASPLEAILYSVDSMTTRGASGLRLEAHWRMMGALEAASGMLLFGISTAYIFALMQAFWTLLSRRR